MEQPLQAVQYIIRAFTAALQLKGDIEHFLHS